jgi:L-fuconolactonase
MLHPFLDAHVHFWDQGVMPYPWLAEVPSIAHRHTPAELAEEAQGQMPERVIFVECGAPAFDEVSWIEGLAAADQRIVGIVAKAPMDAGAATTRAIRRLERRPLVCGVRHIIQSEPGAGFCVRPEFVAGIRQLGPAGLSFDICCRHHQLPAVVALVERCPETRFILDHAGKPDIRAGRLDPWRAHIRSLAALPNVDCKFSGLITEADPADWRVEDLEPFAAHLLETFGPGRLLFGGDWPVSKLAGGYLPWLEAAGALLSELPESDRRAIFNDNASRAYGVACPHVSP